MDGHSLSCGLRTPFGGAPSNRVLVGLPDRLEKSKTALHDAEQLIVKLQSIYVQRAAIGDTKALDVIGELLGFQP